MESNVLESIELSRCWECRRRYADVNGDDEDEQSEPGENDDYLQAMRVAVVG